MLIHAGKPAAAMLLVLLLMAASSCQGALGTQSTQPRLFEVPLSFNAAQQNYLITIGVGTPPQAVNVTLDSGSEELIVNPICTEGGLGPASITACEQAGVYSSQDSSTSLNLNSANDIVYADGQVNFNYWDDTITVPGTAVRVAKQQFGINQPNSIITSGVLGVGFGQYYPNFVDQLQHQGFTKSKTLGVALAAHNGSAVFGGIDTGKFTGTLQKVNLLPADKLPAGLSSQYPIQLDAISTTSSQGAASRYPFPPIVVQPDTGCPDMQLPTVVYVDVLQDLQDYLYQNVTMENVMFNYEYAIDCGVLTMTEGSVNLQFGGMNLQVPYASLAYESPPSSGNCYLQMVAVDPGEFAYCLGLPFLQNFYTVFDQGSPAVWFAPRRDCTKTLVEFNPRNSTTSQLSGQCTS